MDASLYQNVWIRRRRSRLPPIPTPNRIVIPSELSWVLRPHPRCFVSGHDFSRAVKAYSRVGFSVCQGSRQGLKPRDYLARGGTTKVVP